MTLLYSIKKTYLLNFLKYFLTSDLDIFKMCNCDIIFFLENVAWKNYENILRSKERFFYIGKKKTHDEI
jgi:hypothetical protein